MDREGRAAAPSAVTVGAPTGQAPAPAQPVLETLGLVHEGDLGTLLAVRRGREDLLLFVPRYPETGALERERLDVLAGPGIPVAVPLAPDGPSADAGPHGEGTSEALVLEGAAHARTLLTPPPLPDTVWRPALVRLLSALSQAHGRGFVHGRISRGHLLADPSGEFWIHGWAGARRAAVRGRHTVGGEDVARDVRDLGAALIRCLGEIPAAEGADAAGAAAGRADSEAPDAATVRRARDRLSVADPDLARVLARMVTEDPRESYRNATEVLSDLFADDQSQPDRWLQARFVARGPILRDALRHVERAGSPSSCVAAFEIVGPPGSGRTRAIRETARRVREAGHAALVASGASPEQPWGAIGGLARQLLARLPADHPLRADPSVCVLAGERPVAAVPETGGGDRASSVFAELVVAAFASARGALLLDDADALTGHAAHAWRALTRHLSALGASAEGPRVLLIWSAARPLGADLGASCARADLTDLEPRQIAPMLASVLAERGRAALLATEIHALVGGRPADIVDHLREMESRGLLVPIGKQLSVNEPAREFVPRGTDRFRHAVDAAGRDGAALAETLAVAGRLRLARETLAEITDLSGPRLQSAADAALRAGLIVRDGSTWRVRTERDRSRLESALSDDRRRMLHREMLVRVRESEPADWPTIAHHARAAGDPHAGEWTRRALDVLRSAGRFDEAAAHFDDACALVGPSSFGVDDRLLHVDTLLHAGRLDDAIRCAEAVASDPAATVHQRGRAALELARLHRYDQAWSRVLAVPVPEACGDPSLLAHLRLYRATAYLMRGKSDLAAREERLAVAEMGGQVDPIVERHRMEVEYDRVVCTCASARELYSAALACARRSRALDLHFDHTFDLIRLATALAREWRAQLAEAALDRADEWCRDRVSSNAIAMSWSSNIRAFVESIRGRTNARSMQVEKALVFAVRAGSTCLALNRRIHLAYTGVESERLSRRLAEWVRTTAADVHALPADVFAYSGGNLCATLAHRGEHEAIAALQRHFRTSEMSSFIADLYNRWTLISRCLVDDPLLPSLSDFPARVIDEESSDRGLLLTLTECLRGSWRTTSGKYMAPVLSLLALWTRRGELRANAWPAGWSAAELTTLIDERVDRYYQMGDLVFSLLLRPREEIPQPLWDVLVSRQREINDMVPLATEWRRTLARARLAWLDGRARTATRLLREARTELDLLLRPGVGEGGRRVHAEGLRLIEALRIGGPARSPDAARPVPPPVPPAAGPARWQAEVLQVVRARRAVVRSRHLREIREFVETVARCSGGAVRTAPEVGGAADVLFVAASPAADSDRAAVRAAASAHAERGGVVVVAEETGTPPPSGASLDDPVRWLADGVRMDLAPALCDPSSRVPALAAETARLRGRALELTDEARRMVEDYPWPGGLAQLEAVALALERTVDGEISAAALESIGWALRRAEASAGPPPDLVEQVVRVLDGEEWLSSSAVARAVRRPSRTVVRVLGWLSEQGRIVRRGNGRATRYRRTA